MRIRRTQVSTREIALSRGTVHPSPFASASLRAGLGLWLRGAALSGQGGAVVNAWPDVSPRSNHLSGSATGARVLASGAGEAALSLAEGAHLAGKLASPFCSGEQTLFLVARVTGPCQLRFSGPGGAALELTAGDGESGFSTAVLKGASGETTRTGTPSPEGWSVLVLTADLAWGLLTVAWNGEDADWTGPNDGDGPRTVSGLSLLLTELALDADGAGRLELSALLAWDRLLSGSEIERVATWLRVEHLEGGHVLPDDVVLCGLRTLYRLSSAPGTGEPELAGEAGPLVLTSNLQAASAPVLVAEVLLTRRTERAERQDFRDWSRFEAPPGTSFYQLAPDGSWVTYNGTGSWD